MAWQICKINPPQKVKSPSVQIQVVGNDKSKVTSLLINELLSKELCINSVMNYVQIRYDPERNMLGITFHTKPSSRTLVLGKRRAPNGSYSRTINVKHLLREILGKQIDNGTYTLQYEREGDILAIDLSNVSNVLVS